MIGYEDCTNDSVLNHQNYTYFVIYYVEEIKLLSPLIFRFVKLSFVKNEA